MKGQQQTPQLITFLFVKYESLALLGSFLPLVIKIQSNQNGTYCIPYAPYRFCSAPLLQISQRKEDIVSRGDPIDINLTKWQPSSERAMCLSICTDRRKQWGMRLLLLTKQQPNPQEDDDKQLKRNKVSIVMITMVSPLLCTRSLFDLTDHTFKSIKQSSSGRQHRFR